MKVADVDVQRISTVAGTRIQLTVTTDNIPARALLDRGEAFMLANALRDLARRVEVT